VRVLLVDGYPEAPDDYDREAFHLRLALYPAEEIGMGNVPSVIQPKETDASLLASVKLDDYDCIILANDAEAVVEPAMRAKLATYVREGGALLLIPGERVSSAVEDYNKALHFDAPGAKDAEADERLLPAPLAVLQEVEGEPLRLQPQGWTHPIFREFNDARWREFLTDPSVERYLPVSGATLEGARVLATLNDAAESPAIIERSLGAGRIMLFAFGWSPSWGKLYAQPGGLILLHETVLYLARDPAPARTVRLGMPLRWVLDASDYADNVRVILPNGARKSIDPPKPLGDRFVVRVSETQATGFHQIELVPDGADPGADAPSALFAVVGDPSEGDLHPVASEALLAGMPAKEKARVRVAEGVQSGGSVATTGSQREVSRPLLYLLLLVLMARNGRPHRIPPRHRPRRHRRRLRRRDRSQRAVGRAMARRAAAVGDGAAAVRAAGVLRLLALPRLRDPREQGAARAARRDPLLRRAVRHPDAVRPGAHRGEGDHPARLRGGAGGRLALHGVRRPPQRDQGADRARARGRLHSRRRTAHHHRADEAGVHPAVGSAQGGVEDQGRRVPRHAREDPPRQAVRLLHPAAARPQDRGGGGPRRLAHEAGRGDPRRAGRPQGPGRRRHRGADRRAQQLR
jgi:hypothetical protein